MDPLHPCSVVARLPGGWQESPVKQAEAVGMFPPVDPNSP